MSVNNFNIPGLTSKEVQTSRELNGQNALSFKKERGLVNALKSLAREPMVILLLVTSTIYFVTGNIGDGIFLAAAIILVAAISLYQDSRSRNALENLKELTQAHVKVIRNSEVKEIRTEELVLGDSMMVEEGAQVAADGTIIHSNDFSVDESLLTGESLPVYKGTSADNNQVFSGTTVTSGLAIAIVTSIGNKTKLGQIGKSMENIQEEKTPLEYQINNFVKKMVLAGILVFLLVWAINYFKTFDVLDSLLKALTLAMSILPEEIPVAFTTFMALGAWRLIKMGIVVKQMKTVETLGSATVICADKTGTITENKMALAKLFLLKENKIVDGHDHLTPMADQLITTAMWASEPIPFDPMEIALHKAYTSLAGEDERADYKLVHEYPLGGQPPMMTHIFENSKGNIIIAAKGAPEAMIAVSDLSGTQKEAITEAIQTLSADGFRILGVGNAAFEGDSYPKAQQEFAFAFIGLLAFYDPPKKNIEQTFNSFYKAGVDVKLITGDNTETSTAIAREIHFKGAVNSISGEQLMRLNKEEMHLVIAQKSLFTRMFPEAKLTIINVLKEQGQIVAMTGDGVNDGPALKAAHIGVAMGQKGTEIAKQAATLILLEDDLSKMVDAIAMGRRIYSNLKKAIQYIISIHIPIILTVFMPLALGWLYPNIFSPVHIIFLELIMGPTCSIIYENEPMEKNIMLQPPRPITSTFFNWRELAASVIQGLVITAATLFTYRYAVQQGYNEPLTRTMVFTTLIVANIFLTLVNRSFYYSIFTTLRYKNNLVPLIIGITISIMVLLLTVPPLTSFFGFERLAFNQLAFCTIAGLIAVIWFEVYKLIKRLRSR